MNIIEYIKDINDNFSPENFSNFRNTLIREGIRCNYDPINNENNRMILYSNRDSKLAKQCNGLIIDYKTNDILCYPPIYPTTRYQKETLEKELKTATIYKAKNGTVINLYYYNNKWCISSLRGIELNDVKWCSRITYMEALTDCLPDTWDWDNLDVSKTYTIGFTHPRFHFMESCEIWFISSSSEFKFNYDDDIGIPKQEIFEINDSETIENNLESDYLESKFRNLNLGNNLSKIRRYCGNNLETGFAGLVIRTQDNAVIIHSNWMRRMRNICYNGDIIKTTQDMKYDIEKYIIISSYVDNYKSVEIIKLFPHISSLFEQLDNHINDIMVNDILNNDDQKMVQWRDYIKHFKPINKINRRDILSIIKNPETTDMWYSYITINLTNMSFKLITKLNF